MKRDEKWFSAEQKAAIDEARHAIDLAMNDQCRPGEAEQFARSAFERIVRLAAEARA